MSDVLRELFQLATTTADRSQAETELAAPYSTRASRQIEALSAERIVEEELTAFRVADGQTRSSSSLPPFSSKEPGSATRLRATPFSLVPVSQRRSG
jgi:hypothetical protein